MFTKTTSLLYCVVETTVNCKPLLTTVYSRQPLIEPPKCMEMTCQNEMSFEYTGDFEMSNATDFFTSYSFLRAGILIKNPCTKKIY